MKVLFLEETLTTGQEFSTLATALLEPRFAPQDIPPEEEAGMADMVDMAGTAVDTADMEAGTVDMAAADVEAAVAAAVTKIQSDLQSKI